MLARLQRRLLAGLVVAMLLAIAAGFGAGHPVAGVVIAAWLASGFAWVLALEFVLMAAAHADDPTPRASVMTLIGAWWTECVFAVRVFGWQQPFREHTEPDVQGRQGVRGIVFVHGYLCNRAFWNPWLERCEKLGVPCVAVSLEPVFSELPTYADQVERAVAKLEGETHLAPLLVCHSMGGLVARAWMAAVPGADARVHRTITIGSPHGGTWLARFGGTVNARHMCQSNAWLRSLAASESVERYRHFTCFFGHADNMVFPPPSATLPGADNRHLPATPHVAMAFHPDVTSEVLRWLTADAAERVI